MTAERWRLVERIYHDAAARPGDERPAYLDQACGGDSGLRREVERMLASGSEASGFLETPAAAVAARALARSAQLSPGVMVGPYEVVSMLGAGGMGEVYKARDTRLGRTVAIKVLPAGAGSGEEHRKRFLREARSASALNHPHIITIHDIVSEEGRDSIVMEYVEGTALDKLVRGNGLEIRLALRRRMTPESSTAISSPATSWCSHPRAVRQPPRCSISVWRNRSRTQTPRPATRRCSPDRA